MTLQKLKYNIQRTLPDFFLPASWRKAVTGFRKLWADWKVAEPQGVILMDTFDYPESEVARSYFVNVLAKRHQAAIYSFSSRAGRPPLRRLYSAFNVRDHIIPTLSSQQRAQVSALMSELRTSLRTKRDVYDLRVRGAWIGIEIYEEYLSRCMQPTVKLEDPDFWKVCTEGVSLAVFWDDYFHSHKVKAVVVSHDCYLAYGLICKIAYNLGVPVYLAYPTYFTRILKPFSRFNYFFDYRKRFARMPEGNKRAGIELAKKQLDRRFGGEVGVDMPYSKKSAWKRNEGAPRLLPDTDKTKVLICSHCFFDSPHAYGELLFVDFWDWLHFLGEISNRTDYEWFLKVHPDPLPGTIQIVKEILAKYPKIKMLPIDASHLQLVDEGLDWVLTVYGSVGHEYPAMGVPVMNAGLNPHIAYDFNFHPESLEQYEAWLLNLDKLPQKPLDWEAFYEFYFVHYYCGDRDDLIFPSYKRMTEKLSKGDRTGPGVLNYLLDVQTQEQHARAIKNIEAYLDSGLDHAFLLESRISG